MAQSATALQAELSCPVCFGLFREPVSLPCQHSFCQGCLKEAWIHRPEKECPVCRRKGSFDRGVPNLMLQNIVEAYRREGRGASRAEACEKHGDDAGRYCEDCGLLFCPNCPESEKHSHHSHLPVRDATLTYKKTLHSQLQSLQEKLKTFSQECAASEYTVHHIKSQAQMVSRQIKAEFMKLHQFLRDEEHARLAALREEEKKKIALVNERVRSLTEEMVTLTETISDVERMIETKDSSFLEGSKSMKERVQSKSQDPGPVSGTLIDVAKHLGSLAFRVWEKMQSLVQYTPVSLDVNSAHPDLRISDCLREVWDGQASLPLPDNAERFDSTVGLLGSPAFTSGTHSWDVEVGNKPAWTLGVARASVARKGQVSVSPGGGLWAVGLSNGAEFSAGTAPWGVPLALKRKPRRVRVRLDYDGGEVSFFDTLDMSLIHTFKETFTEPLFPYFSPCLNTDGKNSGALKICPADVSITVTS